MKEINYWQQFMTTGRVEDYLHYRSCYDDEKSCDTKAADSREDKTGIDEALQREETAKGRNGDTGYAGTGGSDGDRPKGDAYR